MMECNDSVSISARILFIHLYFDFLWCSGFDAARLESIMFMAAGTINKIFVQWDNEASFLRHVTLVLEMSHHCVFCRPNIMIFLPTPSQHPLCFAVSRIYNTTTGKVNLNESGDDWRPTSGHRGLSTPFETGEPEAEWKWKNIHWYEERNLF